MRWTAVLGLLVCCFVAPRAVSARLADFHFAELVEKADSIVVGRIVAIDTTTPERLAQVVVEQPIAGLTAPVIYIDTHSTWTCDVSADTRVGDRGLMFLHVTSAGYSFTHSGNGFIRLRSDPVDQIHIAPSLGPIIWPSYLVEDAGHSSEKFTIDATSSRAARTYDVAYVDFTLSEVIDYIHGLRGVVRESSHSRALDDVATPSR